MGVFKQSTTVTGNYKEIVVRDGEFIDPESGEIINVASELESIYGDGVFSLTTKSKVDIDIE